MCKVTLKILLKDYTDFCVKNLLILTFRNHFKKKSFEVQYDGVTK